MPHDLFKGFIILFLILVPLERGFPLHKQKIFRKGWVTDAIYFFIGHLIGKAGLALSGVLIIYLLSGLVDHELQRTVAAQPALLQSIEAVIISDISYYIAHKLTHEIPWLWKFHAVHHSIEEMDWLAAVRVHPLDQIFTKMFQIIPLYLLGFTKETLGAFVLFGAFMAFFIHANIRWKFGIIRWVLATPEFHHWHHSAQPKAHKKNFAAQLPILDLIFGTLYMPVAENPEKYGIQAPVPNGYIGQFFYPFWYKKRKN